MYVVDIERLLNRTEHTKTNERTKTKKNNKRLLQVFSFLPKIWNNIGIVYPQPTNQPNNLQDIYPCPMSQDDDHHHHHRQNIHPIQTKHTHHVYILYFFLFEFILIYHFACCCCYLMLMFWNVFVNVKFLACFFAFLLQNTMCSVCVCVCVCGL